MSTRNKLKINRMKYKAKRYIFSGRYIVRNALAVMVVATVIAFVVVILNLPGKKDDADDKSKVGEAQAAAGVQASAADLSPIGKIGDVEIMFLHGHSEQEAKEKWERRCKRINWDRLIVKFNDQNGCTEEHAKKYAELPFEHKLFFTVHDWDIKKWDGLVVVKQRTGEDFVTTSHEPFVGSKYIDITGLINSL